MRYGTVVLWMTVVVLGLYCEWTPHYLRRFGDFARLERALACYRADHGAYPMSGGSFSVDENWIPGLVPRYLTAVPQDPRHLTNVRNKQYLYISNGIDYKLIAHAPEDFGFVAKTYPERVDPRRPSYAYGIWTPGAAEW